MSVYALLSFGTRRLPARIPARFFAMKAIWKGTVIAESDDIVVVEGNNYFPKSALNMKLVENSSTHTHCGWKGQASYYTLLVNGEKNPDACWYYPDPMKGAEQVKDRVAFWKGVKFE